MIVAVRHCASTAVEVVVSEDPDGVNPATQFMLLIAQNGRDFSIALDSGDSIDFEEGTEFDEGEVRRVRHLYKETIEGG